jgi:chromosome segregation protein
MRLERLEIAGFKSFSDRSELAFDEGVTAIVGPNGCGKSNVADAITWVLGEQSAKSLRGERMEDVIFSGSDARRPGATAEVRLRLSGLPTPAQPASDTPVTEVSVNTLREFHPVDTSPREERLATDAGHELDAAGAGAPGLGHPDPRLLNLVESFTRDVEVTRRLYRSGESEYLIDGQVCRLRDVHELLMDTGLGAKAYAIIEQGKIGLILSSRPTDRRQLIEEAAGITKYKSRRRSAELKLEAAQQNLTRVDDIVFEVDRQRGTLKRQAAKARRYTRLRDELRRWEKVLFARRGRELSQAIESARSRLASAREAEAVAMARVAEVEVDLGRLRLEQAEADRSTSSAREQAHGRELDITRRQQQIEFDRRQSEALAARAAEIAEEVHDLESRREPARIALDARQSACGEVELARDTAAARLEEASAAQGRALQGIEALESDVEAARSEVFSALNAATALRHAMEHAATQRDRVGEHLSKLAVETDDLRRDVQRVETERAVAGDALGRAHRALADVGLQQSVRDSELAVARSEHESRVRRVRSAEQDLAGLEARLASLEELVSTRGEFGDAARMVLVRANGHVGQQGAVADYLDVDRRYERAVEACLGDLLQHVIVERHEQAAAGLSLVREHDAGRCGFVVVDPASNGYHPREALRLPGVVPVSDVLRVVGPYAATIQKVIPEAYVAETFDQAVSLSRETTAAVATIDGDVFRGPHLVSGGAKAESRGILATKREIKDLLARVSDDRQALVSLTEEVATLDLAIAQSVSVIAALQAEQHRLEKEIVAHEAQLTRLGDDSDRLGRKSDVVALERRQAEEEGAVLDARTLEAQQAIERLHEAQRLADQLLSGAQRRLVEARDAASTLSQQAAEVGVAHAGLLERASALAADVARLRDTARELEERVQVRSVERERTLVRREELLQAVGEAERALDEDVLVLDGLRQAVRISDDVSGALRLRVDAQDVLLREARQVHESARTGAGELGVECVRAEGDLLHLAQTCADTLQLSLDRVCNDVEEMERRGETTPDAAAIAADDPDPDDESVATLADADAPVTGPEPEAPNSERGIPSVGSMSADEAITRLKEKIERLGPVNMMAIEQFDELETRHAFLTTQRQDLIDSIAQTMEAITRIDETSKARFADAFAAIQANFQTTFSTLFGGGRAGLTLLDENDPLESGIDIVASPPGKRLQSVQLLSGGEKALTAIALMFAIFRYKPSPFCLLDEIDAPLDDANVGRFVEMLRGMLDRTQFILITHNRRTMEIANRLYGVTMEEPGVSKLISVQLH